MCSASGKMKKKTIKNYEIMCRWRRKTSLGPTTNNHILITLTRTQFSLCPNGPFNEQKKTMFLKSFERAFVKINKTAFLWLSDDANFGNEEIEIPLSLNWSRSLHELNCSSSVENLILKKTVTISRWSQIYSNHESAPANFYSLRVYFSMSYEPFV